MHVKPPKPTREATPGSARRSGRSGSREARPFRSPRGGGTYALESPDGRYLYYSQAEMEEGPTGIWRMPVSGGAATEVVPGRVGWNSWTLGRTGLYYMPPANRWELSIRYLDFTSGRTTEIYRDKTMLRRQWVAVSPDEKWILYAEWPPPMSELMLVENFH